MLNFKDDAMLRFIRDMYNSVAGEKNSFKRIYLTFLFAGIHLSPLSFFALFGPIGAIAGLSALALGIAAAITAVEIDHYVRFKEKPNKTLSLLSTTTNMKQTFTSNPPLKKHATENTNEVSVAATPQKKNSNGGFWGTICNLFRLSTSPRGARVEVVGINDSLDAPYIPK